MYSSHKLQDELLWIAGYTFRFLHRSASTFHSKAQHKNTFYHRRRILLQNRKTKEVLRLSTYSKVQWQREEFFFALEFIVTVSLQSFFSFFCYSIKYFVILLEKEKLTNYDMYNGTPLRSWKLIFDQHRKVVTILEF